MDDLTHLLERCTAGDPSSAEALLPLVYEELRHLAARRLAQERPGQTLQATALVHEAWLRIGAGRQRDWAGRRHFFAAAAEAMRHILIDHARRKKTERHGGGWLRLDSVDFSDLPGLGSSEEASDRMVQLSEVLDRFAHVEPRKAELVKLRFFAGLTLEEAAEVLSISEPTAKRDWAFARAWLFREMQRTKTD
ncbi:MAG: sigma-70 family RNA polymerase sigma factor [Verrucomicrobiales bacterium]|nr:sigma-70 family RNA polymerase sigma factor [Verrucomicrobiales bacterium]